MDGRRCRLSAQKSVGEAWQRQLKRSGRCVAGALNGCALEFQIKHNALDHANSSSGAFASFRSRTSKPSVNHPIDGSPQFVRIVRYGRGRDRSPDQHQNREFARAEQGKWIQDRGILQRPSPCGLCPLLGRSPGLLGRTKRLLNMLICLRALRRSDLR
jgi:hypothetical protein